MQRTEGYPTSSNFNLRLGVGSLSSDSLNGKSVGSATGGARTADRVAGGWVASSCHRVGMAPQSNSQLNYFHNTRLESSSPLYKLTRWGSGLG